MKNLFIFIMLSGLSLSSLGQGIDSLWISPDDPITSDDEVEVLAATIHPNSPCPIIDSSVSLSNDTVIVMVNHEMGLLTAICNAIDTIALGTYDQGTYQVAYYFSTGIEGTAEYTDTAYTEFTVEGVNRTLPTEHTEEMVQLFPNPGSEFLMVETEARGAFAIFNVEGRMVEDFRLNQSPFRLNISELESGLYFLLSVEENQAKWTAKFLVR